LLFFTSAEVAGGSRPIQAFERAFKDARRAIALDDHDAWGHFALGFAYTCSGGATEAVPEFEQALALNPNFALAFTWLGCALAYIGRGEEALSQMEVAERLNPRGLFRGRHAQMRSVAYFVMGRHRDALDFARKAVQEKPRYCASPSVYRGKQRFAWAVG
jgi:tetratricopeptide (TPR) repeat protein